MEPRFEIEQRGCQPSLLLLAVAPMIDSRCPILHARVNGLEDVRRLQADPQLAEEAEPVERQRLLKALIQTCRSRSIEEREFGAQLAQRALRRLVRRVFVRGLELPPHGGTVSLREICEHVLALMPL